MSFHFASAFFFCQHGKNTVWGAGGRVMSVGFVNLSLTYTRKELFHNICWAGKYFGDSGEGERESEWNERNKILGFRWETQECIGKGNDLLCRQPRNRSLINLFSKHFDLLEFSLPATELFSKQGLLVGWALKHYGGLEASRRNRPFLSLVLSKVSSIVQCSLIDNLIKGWILFFEPSATASSERYRIVLRPLL